MSPIINPSGGGGGGSQPGAVTVRAFSFAFDTAGLAGGVTVYTPTIGDILLDAWVEIDTAFNGTTPFADVGTFVGQTTGLWRVVAVPNGLDLTVAGNNAGGGGLFIQAGQTILGAQSISTLSTLAGDQGLPLLPGRFTTTDPLKLVVSQDGTKGGAAIGGTTGAARLYIVTSAPVAVAL